MPGDMNWNYYGNKTEGWMPQDLVDLTEKARFVAWKRHGNERREQSSKISLKIANFLIKNKSGNKKIVSVKKQRYNI